MIFETAKSQIQLLQTEFLPDLSVYKGNSLPQSNHQGLDLNFVCPVIHNVIRKETIVVAGQISDSFNNISEIVMVGVGYPAWILINQAADLFFEDCEARDMCPQIPHLCFQNRPRCHSTLKNGLGIQIGRASANRAQS